MRFTLPFLATTCTILTLGGVAHSANAPLSQAGLRGRNDGNGDGNLPSPKLNSSLTTQPPERQGGKTVLAQEPSDLEKLPAESASPIDVPAFVPAEGERTRLLQALESDRRCQLQGPHDCPKPAYLDERFQELCEVLAKTVFGGLIFGHAVTEQAQQEIFTMVGMLRAWSRRYKHTDYDYGNIRFAMDGFFSQESLKSYMKGMEKKFKYARDILQSLDDQSKTELLNLISSLSTHQLANSMGYPIALEPGSSQAITQKLTRLLDELDPEPRTAIGVLELAREAIGVPEFNMNRFYGSRVDNGGGFTPEELLARDAIKYFERLYPEHKSNLFVDEGKVRVLWLGAFQHRFKYGAVYCFSPWLVLVEHWQHFVEDLPRVVDAAVSELNLRSKVVEELGRGLSKSYIADSMFLNADLRLIGDWLWAVRRYCRIYPDFEECNELPGMIELYQQQRARFIEACGHASGLSQSARRGGDIMPKVEAFVPDIRLE